MVFTIENFYSPNLIKHSLHQKIRPKGEFFGVKRVSSSFLCCFSDIVIPFLLLISLALHLMKNKTQLNPMKNFGKVLCIKHLIGNWYNIAQGQRYLSGESFSNLISRSGIKSECIIHCIYVPVNIWKIVLSTMSNNSIEQALLQV